MANKFKRVISCIAAAAMLASMTFTVQAAGTLRINNGAGIEGYSINGSKVKMSVADAPDGTAKIRWYMGIDSATKELVREVEGSDGTFWADLQPEKKYIFAEALDAAGNVLAANDNSMQYGSDLKTAENIFSIDFEGEYKWYGFQTITNGDGKNGNPSDYYRSSNGGKVGVSYGNPTTVSDPTNDANNCMKLNNGNFNLTEAIGDSIDYKTGATTYKYTLDKSSIYVLEADMMFETLPTEKIRLAKVTYQTQAQVDAGDNASGTDSVPIEFSDGSFDFYGNRIPAEPNRWYNVKYVYDAINGRLTALVDNQYLGLSAGFDMVKWGRLAFVEDQATMYLDNVKLTRYTPAATLAKDGTKLTANAGSQIWRSVDGIIYKKVSDSSEFTMEELPYKQYFVSRAYNGDSFSQSQVIEVPGAYQKVEKTSYIDCDFSSEDLDSFGCSYDPADKSKFSIKDGKLVITGLGNATYDISDSGLNSGTVYVEADVVLNNWRNYNVFTIGYLYQAGWKSENINELSVQCSAYDYDMGGNLFITYTDTNGETQRINTGMSYRTQVHYKAAVDFDKKVITLTMNGKEFVIDDLRGLYTFYFVRLGSYQVPNGEDTVSTVDNVECYKYETKDVALDFGFAEKSYLRASDKTNNIASGMTISTVITNDADPKSFVSYAAAYNADGTLAEVRKSNTAISGDSVVKNFRFANEYQDSQIKLFSWDDNFKPVLSAE